MRTFDFSQFFTFLAVLMGDVIKLVICLILVFIEQEGKVYKFWHSIYKTVFHNIIDTLQMCVVSLLFLIQNNLLYVSAANLDAATYQVRITNDLLFV